MITDHLAGDTESTPLKTGLYQVFFKSKICITIGAERSTFEFDGITIELPLVSFPIARDITRTPCECGFSGFIVNEFQEGVLGRMLEFLATWLGIKVADMTLLRPDDAFPALPTAPTPTPLQSNQPPSATEPASSILTDFNISDTPKSINSPPAASRPRSSSYDEVGDFELSLDILRASNADSPDCNNDNSSSSLNSTNNNNSINQQADDSIPSSSSPHDTNTNNPQTQPSAPTTPVSRPRNGTSARGTNRGAADWVSPVKSSPGAGADGAADDRVGWEEGLPPPG